MDVAPGDCCLAGATTTASVAVWARERQGREADFSTARPTLRPWAASVEMTVVAGAKGGRTSEDKQRLGRSVAPVEG